MAKRPRGIDLAVVGSRDFCDKKRLYRTLDRIHASLGIRRVISGGARGADSLAEEWAKANGIPVTVYHADWDRYGRSAGYRRNVTIIEDCERVVAFWDGKSAGTKHSIDLSRKLRKPRMVIISTRKCKPKPVIRRGL